MKSSSDYTKMRQLKDYLDNHFKEYQAREKKIIDPILELIKKNTKNYYRFKIMDEIIMEMSPHFNEMQWDYISSALCEAESEATELREKKLKKKRSAK